MEDNLEIPHKFQIGDVAHLDRNPLDEQLGEFINTGPKLIIGVKDVSHLQGTSGQWVKIEEYGEWIDSSYFSPIDKSPQKIFIIVQTTAEEDNTIYRMKKVIISNIIRKVYASSEEEAIGKFVKETQSIPAGRKLDIECIELDYLKSIK
jgi:hypothetical protein